MILITEVYRPFSAKTINSKQVTETVLKAIRSNIQLFPRLLFTGDLIIQSVNWISQTVNTCTT